MSNNKSDSKELVKPDHQVKDVPGGKPYLPRGYTEFEHSRKNYSDHYKTPECERDVEDHSFYIRIKK